jgi:hypothetical protein
MATRRSLQAIARLALSGFVLVAMVGFAAPGSSAAAACPNEALRLEQRVTDLPDCMALEMVSPPFKANRRAGQVSALGAASISADDDRVLFESPAALGETEGLGSPTGDRYVSSRGAAGWSTAATAPPAALGFGFAGVTSLGLPLSLTPDFDRWFSLQNTVTQAQNGQMTAYEAALGGGWTPRSGLLNPLDGHHGLQQIREILNDLSATSADLSHLFVRPANALITEANAYSTTYLPGDPQPLGDALGETSWNTYVLGRGALGEPTIALLGRDSSGKAWGGNCGTFVGGGGVPGISGGRNQGAVSADGTEVLFSTRPAQPQPDPGNPTRPLCLESGVTAAVIKNNPTLLSVVTAKGTGTTSETAEPNVVTGVTTSTGAFAVGQTVTISGSTVAAGTTITAIAADGETTKRITLSNPVTAGGGSGKELKAGAQPFAVGEEVSATTACLAGPCFAPGTTITAVNGLSVTVSPAPENTGANKTLTAIAPLRIMRRDETSGGPTISELVPGGPAGGSDFYEGASVDQSRVYFTSSRRLTGSDIDPVAEECSSEVKLPTATSTGCDLYLYEELPGGGHEVVQVSAGGAGDPTPGLGANVYKGVVAISGDGSHVYFGAQGVLTTDPNPEGAVAQAGKLNLYLYERDAAHPGGHTAFVGELDTACTKIGSSSPDCGRLVGPALSYWNNSSAVPMNGVNGAGEATGGDGHILAFVSTAALTANDKDGKHIDAFRYDAAAETLECVSCLPGGVDDAGAFDLPGRASPTQVNPGLEFAEHQSWVSEDGTGVVFATAERLLAADVDGGLSDYLWQEGQLSLLPGSSQRPAISHDGAEVAFETAAALLPQDGDTAVDVYVARAGGGYPNPPPPPPPCVGEACQGPLSPAAAIQPPPSQDFKGRGNVKPKHHKKKHQKKHRKHHKKKHQKKRHSKRAGDNRNGGHR